MNLQDAVTGIVDALNAAGIRATADPRDLNLPGVLVAPPELHYRYQKGGMAADWELWCLVPDNGRLPALGAVSDLMQAVQDALGWHAQDARPTDAVLPDGSTPPGYILTFTETLRD